MVRRSKQPTKKKSKQHKTASKMATTATASDQPPNATTKPTVYFGYGSNLWLQQMATRCPTSTYLGVGRLDGFRWLINERGYANVVEVSSSSSSSDSAASPPDGDWTIVDAAETCAATENSRARTADDGNGEGKYGDVVYGLVFELKPADEEQLDCNEGVPYAYTKETMAIQFWDVKDAEKGKGDWVDVGKPPTRERDTLVYIDRLRVGEDKPKKEYVGRMNHGIADAVKMGVPEEYVKEVMRRFIPDE